MNIKRWLPAFISLGFIVLVIIISLTSTSNLPTFSIEDEYKIDKNEINNIIKMLDTDNKSNAKTKLDELYKNHTKDDDYYLTDAKIIMATSNKIDAVGTLENVVNRTEEYYDLMLNATAGEFFTYGKVPDRLIDTAIEAANKNANNIKYQILAGELFYDKDNYSASIYYLDKALQINPSNVDANYYYALNIYLLGEQEVGIAYMEEAKKLYKGDDTEFKNSIDNYISLMKEGKR